MGKGLKIKTPGIYFFKLTTAEYIRIYMPPIVIVYAGYVKYEGWSVLITAVPTIIISKASRVNGFGFIKSV